MTGVRLSLTRRHSAGSTGSAKTQLGPKPEVSAQFDLVYRAKVLSHDSLISQCPIPQVFINIITEGKGTSKKTICEVVDGQQRLRAILEFMTDEWPLIATTAKFYPVSDTYRLHVGKEYSDDGPGRILHLGPRGRG